MPRKRRRRKEGALLPAQHFLGAGVRFSEVSKNQGFIVYFLKPEGFPDALGCAFPR
jgi:hypothetical protein